VLGNGAAKLIRAHAAGRPKIDGVVIALVGSADLARGVLDCGVDVGGTDVDLLGDVLGGLQPGIVERLRECVRADDQESGFAVVDELAEFLDIRTGNAAPEVISGCSSRSPR
jgi:hypothetical protein